MRALAWLVLLASCSNPSILTPDPPPAERIGLGRSIDAQLASNGEHRYRIELAADQVARGVVQQDGVDAVIDVFDPSGKKLGEFDSPNGDHGPEPFVVAGSAAGAYDIDVHGFQEAGEKVTTGKIHTSIDTMITRDAYDDEKLTREVDSPRMRELFRALRHHQPGAADAFWKQLAGHAPLVEPYPGDPKTSLVTWVMRTSEPYVGMVDGPSPFEQPMVRIADSDLYYLSARVPADSDLIYVFIPAAQPPSFHEPYVKDPGLGRFAKATPDPNNPLHDQQFSRVQLPAAPSAPLAEVRAGVVHGTLTEIHLASTALKEDRLVGIYTPPGYDPKQTYPLVIAFDGEVYGLPPVTPLIPLPTILDNLIADKKLPPVVAAIVANQGQRGRDLSMYVPFGDFVANELVPRLRADYHAGLTAPQVVVTGSSLGGLQSAFIGLHHSDVVGNVLSNSGAFWVSPARNESEIPEYVEGALAGDYVASPKLPVRFYMDCGLFEGLLRDTNRQLRDILRAKGYDVTYREYSGNHDYGQWKRTIADGLVALLGQRS